MKLNRPREKKRGTEKVGSYNSGEDNMSGWKCMQVISPLTLSIVVMCVCVIRWAMRLYGGQMGFTNMAAWNVRFLKGVHPAKV